MLKDAGFELEALSDSSSVSAIDSEAEEEGETIEINQKIEEMRRVISVATLLQEKLLIVSRLADYAWEIGVKRTIEHIICSIIPQIIKKEKEEVKLELIKQFLPLAKVISENRDGYNAVIWEIIPHYKGFLSDQSVEINKAACDSFYEIETLLNPKDILDSILPIILELAHDSNEDESRSLAVSLMAHFASKID